MLLKVCSHTPPQTHTRKLLLTNGPLIKCLLVFGWNVAGGSKSAVLEVVVVLSCGGGGGVCARVCVAATDNDVIPA